MDSKSTDRDLRIDFLRGICLLLIYTRHIRPNVLRQFTPSEIGFSDAAEAFIFLSGLVSGRVYVKAMQSGFVFCLLKAWRRCWQIYVAHIFTLFLNLALIPTIFGSVNARGAKFFQDPGWGLLHAVLLCFFPYCYSILPLYIFLLAAIPLMLWLGRNVTLWGMVLFSFLIYNVVQCWPGILELPKNWSAIDSFNPFAWQFLFFVAVALGTIARSDCNWLPTGKLAIGTAFTGLVVLFLVKLQYDPSESPWSLQADSLPWGKTDLEPLRLIHFALIAYLCWAVVPISASWYQGRLATAVIRCGQYSLPVLCFSVCLTNLAGETLRTCGSSIGREIAANVVGWILLLLFSSLLHGVNRVLSTKPTIIDASLNSTVIATPLGADAVGPESTSKTSDCERS